MTNHELKPLRNNPTQEPKAISVGQRISDALHGHTIRSISISTGYHPETIRRYLNSESRVSADFIACVSREFQLDANQLLLGISHPLDDTAIRAIQTDLLIEELARRLRMIR